MIVSSILDGTLVRVLTPPPAVALMVPSLSGVRPLRASPVVLSLGYVLLLQTPPIKLKLGKSK
jgi:hypothetical protein